MNFGIGEIHVGIEETHFGIMKIRLGIEETHFDAEEARFVIEEIRLVSRGYIVEVRKFILVPREHILVHHGNKYMSVSRSGLTFPAPRPLSKHITHKIHMILVFPNKAAIRYFSDKEGISIGISTPQSST